LEIESKIGTIPQSAQSVYEFLSDFNNFQHLIPRDKVKHWTSDANSCHFSVEGLGSASLRIIEKEPYKLIKISTEEGSSLRFLLWIQFSPQNDYETRVKITLKADLKPMIVLVAKKPLTNFVNTLIDQMVLIQYP
jgi:hypothetical protein